MFLASTMSIKIANKKSPEDKIAWSLIISCWFLYVCMMAGKFIYNAEIIEIISNFGIGKTEAGVPTTIYYVTYAVGQITLSKFLSKINVRKFLLFTVIPSAVVTFLLGFATKSWQLSILLGLMGLFHSGVWPCCVYIVSRYLPDKLQSAANATLSTGFASGLILSYLFSAIFIMAFDWRFSFFFFGVAFMVSLIFFNAILKKIQKGYTKKEEIKAVSQNGQDDDELDSTVKKRIKRLLFSFVVVTSVAVMLENIAYYGISNWMPNLMYDEFGVPSSMSTLFTVLVPVFGLIGPFIGIHFCRRHHYLKVVLGIMLIVSGLILILTFTYKLNMLLSLSLSIIILALQRGIGNIFCTSIPLRCRDLINAGSFTAILNSAASVGASIAPVLSGNIIDTSGRKVYYLVMALFLLLSIITILFSRRISRHMPAIRRYM